MKHLLLFIALFIFSSELQAQDCDKLIILKEDKVDGTSHYEGADAFVISDDGGKTGFASKFITDSSKQNLIWILVAIGSGSCVEENAKINILFTDESRIELHNDGGFNCQKQSIPYFGDLFKSKKLTDQLAAKKILTLRVWTNDGYVQKDLPVEQAEKIRQYFQCFVEKLKL